jgi:translation initiation factor IF-2
MILLVADVEDLRAEADGPASGLVIESHIEQGRGPIANALVEEGSLKMGDFVVAGTTYAKIRSLHSTDGDSIKEASPSTPVIISGFKTLPEFGDEFVVVGNEKEARSRAEKAQEHKAASAGRYDMSSSELIRIINRTNQIQELNIVLRADAQGSLTSVIDSLKALDTDEVAIRVVSSGVGTITENDIHTAATSSAILYGFNVSSPANIKRLASRDKVDIRIFNVIYELIDDARQELSKLLSPEVKETELGRLIVRGIFKTTKSEIICGGEVTKGKLLAPSFARIIRGEEELGEAQVVNLKRGPQDVKEVIEGEMCGVSLQTASKLDLKEGDRIELFTRETISRTL